MPPCKMVVERNTSFLYLSFGGVRAPNNIFLQVGSVFGHLQEPALRSLFAGKVLGAGYFLRADDLFCFAPKLLASAGIQTDFLTRI